jgi:hypothetical protein
MFCCTHVEKCVTVDHFETGCELKRRCVMDENVFIRAETLPELINKLNARYSLDIDSLWVGAIEDGRIGFNRMENAHGHEPEPYEVEAWKKGNRQMWLADWDFCIEKFITQPITHEDFAGLATHE